MQETDVGRAIIFWGRASSNASILEAARAHPDRFVPFVSVSPERASYRAVWTRNDPALLAELEREVHAFRKRTFTEVILALFVRDGVECVHRLRGMFAFALWDNAAGRLFCARDRFGINLLKPDGELTSDELHNLVEASDGMEAILRALTKFSGHTQHGAITGVRRRPGRARARPRWSGSGLRWPSRR